MRVRTATLDTTIDLVCMFVSACVGMSLSWRADLSLFTARERPIKPIIAASIIEDLLGILLLPIPLALSLKLALPLPHTQTYVVFFFLFAVDRLSESRKYGSASAQIRTRSATAR